MKLEKVAAQDARRWAEAEMAFGKGAGTARKLLNAEIEQKWYNVPGYSELFEKTYDKLDMGDIALKALKERRKLDRAHSVQKNTKALLNGNVRGMNTGIAVAFTVGVVLHQTGYDKVLYYKAKNEARRLKVKYDRFTQNNF